MGLKALSIIPRATDLIYGIKEGSDSEPLMSIKQLADKLYGNGKIPFTLNNEFEIPLHLLSPRIFAVLDADELQARNLWNFLCRKENVIRMITATELGKPAAEAMSYPLVAIFGYRPQSTDQFILFKQVTGYMIKVIMELFGYVVDQKKVKVGSHKHPETIETIRFFTTASRYRKLTDTDLKDCLSELENQKQKEIFSKNFYSIKNGETNYQIQYSIDKQVQ
jgi:hypothetical protein